jgi:hypothetical protein
MTRSIWAGGAKVSKPKSGYTPTTFPLAECVTFPLYVDLADPMGAMVLDQNGKSIYRVSTGRISSWCNLIMSESDVDILMAEVQKLLNDE